MEEKVDYLAKNTQKGKKPTKDKTRSGEGENTITSDFVSTSTPKKQRNTGSGKTS